MKGGIHLHVDQYHEEQLDTHEEFDHAGIEYHSRTPIHSEGGPDHIDCPVVNGWCWHDGTSLGGRESKSYMEDAVMTGNHAPIWRLMEMLYEDYFERDND